jgi:hypothetical protein
LRQIRGQRAASNVHQVTLGGHAHGIKSGVHSQQEQFLVTMKNDRVEGMNGGDHSRYVVFGSLEFFSSGSGGL